MTRTVDVPRRAWMAQVALGGLAALGLTGCANYYYGDRAGPGLLRTDLIEANERAADALLLQARPDPTQPVLVATLVNVDWLFESSRLGRMFSEQISARLVQRGLRVTEVKLRDSLLLEPAQGEILLSREAREVSRAQNAQAVLVGTYAVSATVLYVNLKLVNPVGNTVIAAHSYALPMDDNVRTLLTGR